MDDTLTEAPSVPGHPVCALACAPVPEAAVATRTLVRTALTAWGMAELIDDAGLVVTELVSNAIRSGADIAVEICPVMAAGASLLRIEVFDTSPNPPERRGGGLLEESGKGLHTSWPCSPLTGATGRWTTVRSSGLWSARSAVPDERRGPGGLAGLVTGRPPGLGVPVRPVRAALGGATRTTRGDRRPYGLRVGRRPCHPTPHMTQRPRAVSRPLRCSRSPLCAG
jgi:hypothetical protein